jgi:hypothetical protein
MPLQVYVDAYCGHRGQERPTRFELDAVHYVIYAIDDQWYEPDAQYFKVRADGRRYVLRYDLLRETWTLESDYDGVELFSRPNIALLTVDPATIRQAERYLGGCEQCHPQDAEIPFDWVLADILDKPGRFDFVLSETARCPNCRKNISEKTLVEVE